MTDAVSPFERFELDSAEPAWSSAALEAAIDGVLAEASAGDLLDGVHALLGRRSDLTRTHAHFVRDLVKALVRRSGPALGALESLAEKSRRAMTPGQALLAAYVLPKDRIEPVMVLRILDALDDTPFFDEGVIELQDLAVRADVAKSVFAERPDLAKRIRAALTR